MGAPRSGTTWLAKIVDSHPDVLYRHEPDQTLPAPSHLTPDAVPALLARWAADRSPRTVTKRPYFEKSWQPAPANGLRTVFAAAVSVAALMPPPFRVMARLNIPDFATRPVPRIAVKSINWGEGGAVLAATLPESRTILILRHPCGQVASVMLGNRQRRFELKTDGTDMPFDEARASRFAASLGIAEAAFQALPDPAKYAWSWRAFNEPAYAVLASRPNVHVLLYEALCAWPETMSRRILAFAGLDWTRQTEDFVARSTSYSGAAGYYAVYRDAAAAEAWRTRMPLPDQDAVRSVMGASPLARFWPDLMHVSSSLRSR